MQTERPKHANWRLLLREMPFSLLNRRHHRDHVIPSVHCQFWWRFYFQKIDGRLLRIDADELLRKLLLFETWMVERSVQDFDRLFVYAGLMRAGLFSPLFSVFADHWGGRWWWWWWWWGGVGGWGSYRLGHLRSTRSSRLWGFTDENSRKAGVVLAFVITRPAC